MPTMALLKAVDSELLRRDSWQGKKWERKERSQKTLARRMTLPVVAMEIENRDVRPGQANPVDLTSR